MAGKQNDQSTTSLNTTTTTTTITTSKSKMCESPPLNESPDGNTINNKNNTASASSASTSTKSTADECDKEPLDCPVCLQTCMHPARLPCGHIFCFLCIKGVAYKNRRCALCRREIPPEFLDNPHLVNTNLMDLVNTGGYQWYYEGRNGGWWRYDERSTNEIEQAFLNKIDSITLLICGDIYCIDLKNHKQYKECTPRNSRWWQYDERTSQEIEECFNRGDKFCTILVAGYVYIVDFEQMSQQRQNAPGRRRLVKRDLSTIQKKGVAGLRFDDPSNVELPVATTLITSTTTTTTATITTALLNTVTDTALRIASNIIDSTLAYPDADTPSSVVDNNNVTNSNNNNRQELINEIRQSLYTSSEASTSSNSNSNNNRLSTSQHINALLENAITDLETLTIQNLASEDSSDDDQNDIGDIIIGNKIRLEDDDDDENNLANDDDDDDDEEDIDDEDDDEDDYNENNFGPHSSVNIKYKKL